MNRLPRLLALALLILGNIWLLYSLVFGESGVFAYLHLKSRHAELESQLASSEEKNLRLSREISWLKEDRAYLERMIRSQMNFLGQDEVLYIFSAPNNDTPGDSGADHD
jgi:cell division protein FtsB